METKAIILIETKGNLTGSVMAELKKASFVKTLYAVTGPYDVIAEINAEDLSELGDIIYSQVRNINGITKTTTCVATNY